MNVINEALNLGDLVKYEEDSLNYSRDVVTVEAGQNLPLGCIVGRVTATAKVKQLDPNAVGWVPLLAVVRPRSRWRFPA
jgi:hypothetical protein